MNLLIATASYREGQSRMQHVGMNCSIMEEDKDQQSSSTFSELKQNKERTLNDSSKSWRSWWFTFLLQELGVNLDSQFEMSEAQV